MKKFLFLLAWIQGSESWEDFIDEPTNIHDQDDLIPQFRNESEYVFSVVINSSHEEIALKYGYAEAFHANYTGLDTVSIIIDITNNAELQQLAHDNPDTEDINAVV